MNDSKRSTRFQVFEVKPESCMTFHVTVLSGRNIKKGWMSNLFHTPNPYIQLHMAQAAEPIQRTRTVVASSTPQWKEQFVFYIDPNMENILEVRLLDDHLWYGGDFGKISIRCSELTLGFTEKRTLSFAGSSEVDVELKVELETQHNLRYSQDLPTEEKEYRKCRIRRTCEALKRLLPNRAPETPSRTPAIAVLGSGGGFRAMIGFAGAYKALVKSGVLDCTTYIGSLSGSSWYLSQIYSHPKWPNGSIDEINDELRANVDHTFLWLLKPSGFVNYMEKLLAKRAMGMPVSFTDFFGYLVGDTLLRGRMTSRLSDQRSVVKGGAAPLPLYTCVRVKKDISARVFQEWVEFSPYEIGMPKYGIFFQSHLFGSRFFMGKLTKQFKEPPLHYLQGIWGSAFCILFRRLLKNNGKESPIQTVRSEMASIIDRDMEKCRKRPKPLSPISPNTKRRKLGQNKFVTTGAGAKSSYFDSFLEKICTSSHLSLISTRAARAGVTHNPLRGLPLQKTLPCSPSTARVRAMTPVSARDEFNGIFDLHPTTEEHQYLVDAGLAFNSPYPLVLRPQRTVDIIISYDFSARPSDLHNPFKELKLSEKWARINGVSFPPIDVSVWDPKNPKEMYIFRHPTDMHCPVILHFALVNKSFRKYKAPGVQRMTTDELDFATFDIFDKVSTYSTFKFTYTHQEFNRLSQLMEYNTLNQIENIKTIIHDHIQNKQFPSPLERQNQEQDPHQNEGFSEQTNKFQLLPIEIAIEKFKQKKKLKKFKKFPEEIV